MTSPTRVRLTESAATRFPDLANRAGTSVIEVSENGKTTWVLVHWDGQDAPHTWLPPADVESEDDIVDVEP